MVTGTHVPRLEALTQDSHCPLQATLQQTPSELHTLLAHWLAKVQLSPFGLPTQVPFEQVRPPLHVVPQHGWSRAPHDMHALLEETQVVPVLQLMPAQQVCPLAPQGAHRLLLAEHRYPLAHIEPVQHGCPLPPHAPQVPLEHTSVARLQEVPQHGCPVPPQAVHRPVPAQVMPDPHGLPPEQHGWLLPPQAMQLPAEHTVPDAVHVLPQHGWVAPPHATHMLFVHIEPFAQVLPQQGCPAAPHAWHMPFV